MNLPELYEQQERELEQFKALRDMAWVGLQKEQSEIAAAFGSKENLPEDLQNRFTEQIDNYNREWALETGERYQEIAHKHEKERQAISGKATPVKPKSEAMEKKITDPLSDEKQKELQKIIRQQQAIRKRNEEKKRAR
jgi:hypothetical protein